MKSTSEIRTAFLEFFAEREHELVASSSLVPGNDPTLLFTNAGMVQFKDIFLGTDQRAIKRATSAQRCVRAGGKHNDLDNVGYTARHHTFFEMLGNFSFGDYFKREAIGYAWEFLTKKMGLPPERLWITVFTDDDEAADIWLNEIGVAPGRLTRCGEKDNFWSMGETGPCGPCSEIFYDHGEAVAGGPPGSADADGDRYVEIWNLVFAQYNRLTTGELEPLPNKNVDTGMGLERMAAVLQGVHSNYEIDLFKTLVQAVADLAGGNSDALDRSSLQVVADHIRSCAFLIVDGVVPSNEGRGYVLRRIIRRAIRHGHKLGIQDAFFHRLVAPLKREMGDAYPELAKAESQVAQVLKQEEERFALTLEHGLKIVDQAIESLSGSEIPGVAVFQLYDTYGFPADLTADIARERGLTVDMAGFEQQMELQRSRAKAASQFTIAEQEFAIPAAELTRLSSDFQFSGYAGNDDNSTITGLFVGGEPVATLSPSAAESVQVVVVARTPFYAESGGQIGDRGLLRTPSAVFEVFDTRKQGDLHLHLGRLREGELRANQAVTLQVDPDHREPTRANHSATHLMHAALREVLGEHVTQKGSLVAPDRLRFDFAHSQPVTEQELRAIEERVNAEVRRNSVVETAVMSMDEAVESGALALFGEKYADEVRVLNMGNYSIELCGGTHVARTGDIGLFKIVSEAGTAAGVRRIEAVTGVAAMAWVEESEQRLKQLETLVKGSRDNLTDKVSQLLDRVRQLEKDNQAFKAKLAGNQGADLVSQAVDINGLKVLAVQLQDVDVDGLRSTADQLRDKLQTAAVVLASVDEGKVRLIAAVTKNATKRVKAGELVNFVAQQVGGKGGGRPDMAQAGGNDPSGLAAALESVPAWVSAQLG